MRDRGDPMEDPLARLRNDRVEPDPEFRYALRERLLAEAGSAAGRAEGPGTAPRRRLWARTPLLLGGAVAALLVSAHLAVAGIPPDLDRLKAMHHGRASERQDRERGTRELTEARMRAARVVVLADLPLADPAALSAAFREMDRHTQAASEALTRVYQRTGDRTTLAELAAFVRDQHARLHSMLDRVPTTARPTAGDSLRLVCGISRRARTLLGE